MERHAITSTNLKSVGYDSGEKTLEIEFHHGGVYQYFAVPENIYTGLIGADSAGKFFHANIKGVYQFAMVRSR